MLIGLHSEQKRYVTVQRGNESGMAFMDYPGSIFIENVDGFVYAITACVCGYNEHFLLFEGIRMERVTCVRRMMINKMHMLFCNAKIFYGKLFAHCSNMLNRSIIQFA